MGRRYFFPKMLRQNSQSKIFQKWRIRLIQAETYGSFVYFFNTHAFPVCPFWALNERIFREACCKNNIVRGKIFSIRPIKLVFKADGICKSVLGHFIFFGKRRDNFPFAVIPKKAGINKLNHAAVGIGLRQERIYKSWAANYPFAERSSESRRLNSEFFIYFRKNTQKRHKRDERQNQKRENFYL